MRFPLILATSFVALWSASSFAQDVCCILGKTSGDGTEVRTEITSRVDCKGEDGFKVCSAMNDPENTCSDLEKKDLCGKCGFFWIGDACLAADPMVKAKQQLEAEQKKKQESAAKEAVPPTKK